MMASPLPKTKAPAAVKKVKSAHSVPPVTPTTANTAARGTGEKLATPDFPLPQDFQNVLGGDLTSQTRRPAARNSSTCSACVRMVTTDVTRYIPQSNQSRPMVLVGNSYVLLA